MACVVLDEKSKEVLGRLFAKWDARRRCKIRVVRMSDNEFLIEQGNERLGYSTHGTLLRVNNRWMVRTDEELDERVNGDRGFARRCEAKHALLWFWVDGTTIRDGKILPWVETRV